MPPTIRGLGAVKPHVRKAAEQIAERFKIYNIGGFATSGHITNSDHYKGLAIDVMTTNKGDMVAQWALANGAALSVTYIIWNRRIVDTRNNKGWEPYTGSSPHTDHVHISFHPSPGEGDIVGFAGSGGEDPAITEAKGCLGQIFPFLNK